MDKLIYKDYIGIIRIRHSTVGVRGALIKARFIKTPMFLLDKIYRWVGIYTIYTEILFWCPFKATLSNGNYGTIGKKSRGKYSNLWYEIKSTKTNEFKYMLKHATERFNFCNWINDCKFQKLTNKKLKKYLDQYLA